MRVQGLRVNKSPGPEQAEGCLISGTVRFRPRWRMFPPFSGITGLFTISGQDSGKSAWVTPGHAALLHTGEGGSDAGIGGDG